MTVRRFQHGYGMCVWLPAIERALAEGKAVLAAAGIDAVGQEEQAKPRGGRIRLEPFDGSSRGGGSSWQSLSRVTGTIEADYLNGEIALLGRLYGVPTPVTHREHVRA